MLLCRRIAWISLSATFRSWRFVARPRRNEDGWKSVKPFLQENKLNYPIVIGDWNFAKMYGAEALPVTLLIDRDGRIADLHAGMVDKDAFEREIQILLKEGAPKTAPR